MRSKRLDATDEQCDIRERFFRNVAKDDCQPARTATVLLYCLPAIEIENAGTVFVKILAAWHIQPVH